MARHAQTQQLYITYFQTAADPNGLLYWDANPSIPLTDIANGFATTPQFQASIAGQSLTQIVNSFYVNLFGRAGENAGIAFWVGLINSGVTNLQQVGLNIGNAALALPATNADNIALTSKITAASNWTAAVLAIPGGVVAYNGQAGIDAVGAYLAPVLTTATIPSAADTTTAVNNLIATNAGGTGQTLNASVFTDIFTANEGVQLSAAGNLIATSPFRFTSSNQTVISTVGTIQATDQFVDPTTTDQDTVSFNAGTSTTIANFDVAGSIFTNLENLNFVLGTGTAGTAAGAFNFAGTITGAQRVSVTGVAAGAQTFNLNNALGRASGVTTFDASGLTGDGTNIAGAIVTFGLIAGNPTLTLTGSAINDNLSVATSAGRSVINAGAGNDTVSGGIGADTITGGTGADTLTGLAGVDRFVYNGLADGYDTITDFGTGADVLALASAGFAGAAAAGTTAVIVNGNVALVTPASGANIIVGTNANLAVNANTNSANRFFLNTDGNGGAILAGSLIYDADGNFTTTGDQTLIVSGGAGLSAAVAANFAFI